MRIDKILLLSFCLLAAFACTKASEEQTYAKQEETIDRFIEGLITPCDTLSMVEDGGTTVLRVAKVTITEEGEVRDTITVTYYGGATRVTIQEGDGDALLKRGNVSFFYAGYDFSSGSLNAGSLFATNMQELAASSGWDCVDTDPISIKLSDAKIVDGLKRGLVGVKPGEECVILFSGKSGFGSHPVGTIPPRVPLAYRIWVETVEN